MVYNLNATSSYLKSENAEIGSFWTILTLRMVNRPIASTQGDGRGLMHTPEAMGVV